MDTLTVVQGNTHPLLLLLSDLKSSLLNFQNEAHISAVKLQHHSLSTSRALERTHALEHENSVLSNELHILRSNSHPFLSKDSREMDHESISQMTLSLRTLNEKLTATETILAQRTAELTHTLGELRKSKSAADTAHELSARIRGREEALKSRERELALKVSMAEERARMSERAVEEYANLVRTLEGRAGRGGTAGNGHAIHFTNDEDTQRLLQEFSRERENLQIQLSSTQHDLALLTSEHAALTKSAEVALAGLADLRMKLQLLERDDTTATKMVSRYMKFSQTQTNQLQNSLSTLSTRHAATLSSLTAHIQSLTHALTLAQSHNARLLSALDSLGNELMKEGYGRRREVRLRIKLVGREERVLEGLRRWLRRAEEGYGKICGSGGASDDCGEGPVLTEMIQDAKILIDNLDSPLLLPTPLLIQDTHPPPVSGSLARLITIQSTIDDLVEDVQREQAKRIALEKLVVRQEVEGLTLEDSVERKEDKSESQPNVDEDEVSDLSAELEHNEPANLDPSVRISSSPTTITTELLLNHVEDATSSLSLSSTNRDTTLAEPEHERISIPADTVEALSIPAPAPTLVQVPQPERGTPVIELTLPLASDEQTNLVFSLDESMSEKREAKAEKGDDGMALGREEHGRQVNGSVCDNDIDIDVLETDVVIDRVQGLNAPEEREPLLDDVLGDKTAASKPAEETESNTSYANEVVVSVSENDEENVSIDPPDPDATPPIEPTLAHRQTRSPPQLPVPPLSPLTLPSPSPSLTQSSSQLTMPAPHPLLHDLLKARNRYNHKQRAFHACHIALEGLKASLLSTNTAGSFPCAYPHYSSNNSGDSLSSPSTVIPNDMLNAIVQRLDDYTEDARVELEIQISDEEVMGRGYEALLMLPGALSSAGSSSSSYAIPGDEMKDGTTTDGGSAVDVEAQIRGFIDGTDPTISRAVKSLERKLEDIEHDVMIVKKVMHDPQSVLSPTVTTIESSSSTSFTPPSNQSYVSENSSIPSTGWTSWIRTPISRPTTPTPMPAPTFGNVMTSRNTRPSPVLRRTVSTFGQSSDSLPSSSGSGTDVVRSLGLKVPMPDFGFAPTSSGSLLGGSGVGEDEIYDSPGVVGMGLGLGHAFGMPRSRTISTSMYMLGMGIGGPGVGAGISGKRSPVISPLQRRIVSAAVPSRMGAGGSSGSGGNTVGSSVGMSRKGDGEEEDVD